MSEVQLPPWIIPEKESQELLDEGSSIFRAAFAPGLAQRQSYGGLRLKLSRYHSVKLEEKAQLLAALRSSRGGFNTIRTKVHFAIRGSFPVSELMTNGTFASGLTGWTSGTGYTHTVSDRILRARRSTVTGIPDAVVNSSAFTVTQYAPYVFRAHVSIGRGSYTNTFQLRVGSTAGASTYGISSNLSPGLLPLACVPYGTSVYTTLLDGMSSGLIAGDYFDVSYMSLSRCILVDNGVNLLRRSDEFDNAAWTSTNVTITANFSTAPDGTSTADRIVETTANNQHYTQQNIVTASSTGDFVLVCAMKADGRNFGWLGLTEGTGSTEAYQVFNLSTGALGATSATGANWASLRSFISPLGDGWYLCAIVARKTNAATSVVASVGVSNADSRAAYVGSASATGTIQVWRATLAQASVPVRLVQTQGTASTGTSQAGGGLYVAGLPASTNGLLLPEDVFEVGGEIKTCTEALNSDSAGLGYLQFEPPLVRAPADATPVVVQDPMGKFLVSNIKVDNEFGTQARVSYDLEHIYE